MIPRVAVVAAAFLLCACHQHSADIPPASGHDLYIARCAVCHNMNGEGTPPYYPPLAGSPWVDGPPERLAAIILGGMQGPNGRYNGVMPTWGGVLTDNEIAAIMTCLRQKDGAPPFTPIQVNQVRIETAPRNAPWTVQDLGNLHIH